MIRASDVMKADIGGQAFRNLVSVVAPGALLLGEVYVLLNHVRAVREQVEQVREDGFVLAAIGLVAFLLVAFLVGFVTRRAAFATVSRRRNEKLSAVLKDLEGEFGRALPDNPFANHPVLEGLHRENAPRSAFWAFVYCKLWLRRTHADLAGLERETEINIFAALIVPLLLAPAAAADAVEVSMCFSVFGLGFALGDAWVIRRLFKEEVRDGIRTFILVNAQARVPSEVAPPTGFEPVPPP